MYLKVYLKCIAFFVNFLFVELKSSWLHVGKYSYAVWWCHGSEAFWVRTNRAAEKSTRTLCNINPHVIVEAHTVIVPCSVFRYIVNMLQFHGHWWHIFGHFNLFSMFLLCSCVLDCLIIDINLIDSNERVLCFCNFIFLFVFVFTMSTGEREKVKISTSMTSVWRVIICFGLVQLQLAGWKYYRCSKLCVGACSNFDTQGKYTCNVEGALNHTEMNFYIVLLLNFLKWIYWGKQSSTIML